MSRNDIDQDQINRRLGGSAGSFGRANQNDFRQEQFDDDAESDDSGTLNSGFLVTVLGVFLAVGSLGYFSFGGGLSQLGFGVGADRAAFVSKAEAACAPLWKDNQSNDAALRCYLTTAVNRLCDGQERVHLDGVIKRYRLEWQYYHAGLTAALYKQQANGIGATMAANAETEKIMAEAEAARGADDKMSTEKQWQFNEKLAKLRDDFAHSGGDHSNDPRILQNQAALESQKFEVSHARKIQALVEAGYLTESDFGWFPDILVKKGFANAKTAKKALCS
jgi:hypothetical protein